MYAWFPATAKSNHRRRAHGAVVRVATAKTLQAQGQERGSFCALLFRRHSRRVVEVGECHEEPAVRQTGGQYPNAIQKLYRNIA